MTRTIPLAQYLFRRLGQLGCNSVHGVPGDFFLRALDHIRPAGLKWIGNSSELCAGYAADGYARGGHHVVARRSLKGPRVGALFTTYGVGELSAINAVAGSYAESVPVVHLVGTPSRKAWQAKSADRPLHHSLADGRLGVFAEMAKQVTSAQVNFHQHTDHLEALVAYDEMLETCVRRSKPVYASVPYDMLDTEVPVELLDRPLSLTSSSYDSEVEDLVSRQIAERVRSAQTPLLVVDGLCYPIDLLQEANELAKLIPTACFTAGKGVIDEGNPNWLGGLPTDYQADLVIMLGPLLSDTNTAAWTAIPSSESTIKFGLDSVQIDDEIHPVGSKAVLQKLISELRSLPPRAKLLAGKRPEQKGPLDSTVASPLDTSPISQDAFWTIISTFLKPNDTVILANGTPLLGGRNMKLPTQTQVLASSIWCSIGQMLPAAQGISLAKRDHDIPGRTILFEGDGSFQVTCQALSDIIRYKLDVTIFILNNGGYTYERWLNGMEAEYNDVPSWQYANAPAFFGAAEKGSDYPAVSLRVETWSELQDVLADAKLHDGKGLKLVDVVMDPADVPEKSVPGLRRASKALRT